jgi:excinuclease UvrABC helicase subunit UvrB
MSMIKIVATKDCSLLAQLYEEIQTYYHTTQPKVFVSYNKRGDYYLFRDYFKQ